LQYDRIIKLRGKKTVSQSAFDEIQARRGNARETVETAKANIHVTEAQLQKVIAQKKGARASISERQASVKLAKIRLAYCTIRSPIDGVVIERAVDVGQTVAASLQSPILFTIAEDLTRMPLAVDVSEADVGQIQSGQEVEFSVDVFAEKKFKASVQQIRNSPTSIQNVVTYKVIADVDNSSGLLRPGMTANVSIIVAHRNGVLMVPNAALRFRPPGVRQKTQAKKPSSIKERPIYKRTVRQFPLRTWEAPESTLIFQAVRIIFVPTRMRRFRGSVRSFLWSLLSKSIAIAMGKYLPRCRLTRYMILCQPVHIRVSMEEKLSPPWLTIPNSLNIKSTMPRVRGTIS
jgi:multidrug efflux pump subunit AcrA (membrane-fusion protein)